MQDSYLHVFVATTQFGRLWHRRIFSKDKLLPTVIKNTIIFQTSYFETVFVISTMFTHVIVKSISLKKCDIIMWRVQVDKFIGASNRGKRNRIIKICSTAKRKGYRGGGGGVEGGKISNIFLRCLEFLIFLGVMVDDRPEPTYEEKIRNFKHPKKIFEILATPKNIPYSVHWL